MLRVDEREQQADCDALGSRRGEPVEGGAHRIFVERLDDLAVRSDPLTYPEAHGAWREKYRGLGIEPDLVHLAPHLATDFEGVAEPVGRDDPEPAALAFQHRIGRHRGAVRKLCDGAGLDALLLRQPFHRRDGRVAGVRGGARNLEHDRRPSLALAHHIGERAAHIHTNTTTCSQFGHDRLFLTDKYVYVYGAALVPYNSAPSLPVHA